MDPGISFPIPWAAPFAQPRDHFRQISLGLVAGNDRKHPSNLLKFVDESNPEAEPLHVAIRVEMCSTEGLLSPLNSMA